MDLLIQSFWLLGLTASTLGLIFQLVIYYLIPCSRKLDLKILTQLTLARVLNIAAEYLVTNVYLNSIALNVIVFGLYTQTDAALISWMMIFTKNLYDSIVNVFAPKISFTLATIVIWSVTIPIGILSSFLLELDYIHRKNFPDDEPDLYFNWFYEIYKYVKFIILSGNFLLFCVILKIAMSKNDRVASLLRTCAVFFLLVCISSVQVLVTDLCSSIMDGYPGVSIAFAVMNSYQIIPITVVFVILVQNYCQGESMKQKIAKKLITQRV